MYTVLDKEHVFVVKKSGKCEALQSEIGVLKAGFLGRVEDIYALFA